MGDRLKGPHEKNVWILSYLVPKLKKKRLSKKLDHNWKTYGPPEEKFKFQLKRERNIQS